MGFLRFIFSKTFIKNFALSIIILILIIVSVFIGLRIYTNHGKSVIVPDLKGLTEHQISTILKEQMFRYKIIDSVYTDSVPTGTLWEQIPPMGAKVKKHRQLFLIMNSSTKQSIAMPDLKDLSLRQAETVLESSGLKIGDIIYVPSEYQNLVVGQHFNNTDIDPGEPVTLGSKITILVANGLSDKVITAPNLIGMRFFDATRYINNLGLNVGAIIVADEDYIETETSKDSLFVLIQKPNPELNVNIGSSIALWLTADSMKLMPDTLNVE